MTYSLENNAVRFFRASVEAAALLDYNPVNRGIRRGKFPI